MSWFSSRFVAPSPRDPRITLLVALSAYTLLGQWVFYFNRSPLELALTLVTCMVLDVVLTFMESGKILVPLSGAITGLSLDTKPVAILRAAMEAVALRFALIHDLLPPAREIVASGGALLRSPAWMQILADALGRPVTASAEAEASSRGAALLALEALGHEPAPAALGASVTPDPAHHARYRAALYRQKDLYGKLV